MCLEAEVHDARNGVGGIGSEREPGQLPTMCCKSNTTSLLSLVPCKQQMHAKNPTRVEHREAPSQKGAEWAQQQRKPLLSSCLVRGVAVHYGQDNP